MSLLHSMDEAPNEVALVWLAGKDMDTRNEYIECQRAAGQQVPSNGYEASTNVSAATCQMKHGTSASARLKVSANGLAGAARS